MAEPFDPLLPASILLGGPVDPSQGTVHQQAAFDDATGDVYATQVISGGRQLEGEDAPVTFEDRARRGDIAINRISSQGALLGVMYCRGFDHGAGLGVQRDGDTVYLWTGYDANEAAPGGNGYATKIARYPFDNGAVLDVGDPGIDVYDHAPGFDHITASVDTGNDQIALRYHSGGDYFITVYRLSTFTPADPGTVVYAERQVPVETQFQVWSLYGEYVYNWHGHAGDTTFFTVYDLPNDDAGPQLVNEQYPDITYREAESITVRDQGTDAAILVWGFASGETGDRRINLYGPVPLPPTRIEAEVVPDGVALTVDVEDPGTVTLWQVIRRPDGAILFTGDGADLPDPPVQMLDTAPVRCVDLTYELRVVRESGAEETVASDVVQFVPPEGCGTAGGVASDAETIGCPELYRARIHWRGGALTLPLQSVDELVECTWGRTLNDTSEATATFSRDVYDDCCAEWTDVHPWVHELTVYREVAGSRPEIAWQGPIQRVRIQRDRIIIEASDVFAWLDRLVNTWRMQYTTAAADEVGRRRGTVTYIAQNIIRLNMIESSLSDPSDYAGMYSYIRTRSEGLSVISWRKDGYTVDDDQDPPVVHDRRRIWTEFVGEILRELAKSGLRWTTVGRTLYLRSQSSALSLPTARLNFEDFSGETEIVRDGVEAATRSFATSQQGDELKGRTVSAGRTVTAYGRLDRLVNVQEDDPTEAQLRRIATNDLAGRYPAPMSISMPGTAQLAPEAGVTLRQLVPGERIDVLGDACFALSQGFLLTDVSATWDNTTGEKLSVGLATLPPFAESGDI